MQLLYNVAMCLYWSNIKGVILSGGASSKLSLLIIALGKNIVSS